MGFVVYFMIGAALLTYCSVSQYNRDKEDFIKTKFLNWIWWVATLVCVLLWPLLVSWAIIDAIRETRMLYR